MSSPSNRRQRSSPSVATPRRSTRQSSQLASSPLMFPSSEDDQHDQQEQHQRDDAQVSSPLRQASDSQMTAGRAPIPGSPLRQMTDSQTPRLDDDDDDDDDREATPRASGRSARESSPIRYDPSSSPGRSFRQQSELGGENFVGSQRNASAARRRGDINSDSIRTPRAPRRIILDEAGRVMREGQTPGSDAASFANRDPNTSEADALGGQGETLIWGTTVSVNDTFAAFKDFLRNFKQKYRMYRDGLSVEEAAAAPDAESKPYWEALEAMWMLSSTRLYLDIADLNLYPPTRKLWYQVQAYPEEVIPIMDQSVHDMMMEIARVDTARSRPSNGNPPETPQGTQNSDALFFPSSDRPEDTATPRPPQDQHMSEDEVAASVYVVRPFGLDSTINLRELNPSDMDRLVCIKGLVIRTTPVIPDMKDAFFRCNVCNHSVNVGVDRGKIREPTQCPRQICESKNSMQIVHNRCTFEDKQVIKLQETPDAVPAGQTPHSVSVCVYNELVDYCKAGDRVELTGIFRVSSMRVNPRQRTLKSIYKTYVDVLHVQKANRKRMGADLSTLGIEGEREAEEKGGDDDDDKNRPEETRAITPEEEARIRETATRPDVYELLARSLAPSVHEMDDVKKGILLQLFGGANKTFSKGGSPKYRGDINVLLCGDPSTSKSQLLSYVHKIAPRGIYTSGKGSSAVGLTAYVTRDPETRQLVLESGALVLSDGGVCCIDEFDKMSDGTRSVLHEVMEQQTVSVAKAGIITTLNARSSILASANPIGSRYNPDLSVPQNIDLPPTLLSRFDLVYLILDRFDEKADKKLAKHLLSLYLEDKPHSAPTSRDILPVEFLTSYISFARANVQPTLSSEAARKLVECYVDMRALGHDVRSAEKRITATTRQLESMIRLSEAHAKMRLSDTVTADDVAEANRLIQSALKTAATDAQGRIDMSLLTDGSTAADRQRRSDLRDAVVRLLDEMTSAGNAVRWGDVARRLAEGAGVPVEPADFSDAMRGLEAEGAVTITGEGARRTIRRVTAMV
ncbi:hypothetical protein L249_6826 [Ophiocordyceps polyrhachis-furcata BCC 54312]|uniref:DNA helicase n=1 Tax=Ophiocordyceps polyrhachis-furcata BCC 54312 TaxID=1330021 RepID=A0A367LL16_9HYPO|nr:hypothetical protein L249_6826 [Ophiocordyceps polyrhachis-furcata BCC 54312]